MKLPRTLTFLIAFTGAAFAHREEELTSSNASILIALYDDDRNKILVTLHDNICLGDNAAVRHCSLNVSDHAEVDEACDIYGGSLVQGRQIYTCEAHGGAMKLEHFDKFGCTMDPFVNGTNTTVNETNILEVFQTPVSVSGHACQFDVIDSVRVDGVAVAFERIDMNSGVAMPLWYSIVTGIAACLWILASD